jgi:hypothetical protein
MGTDYYQPMVRLHYVCYNFDDERARLPQNFLSHGPNKGFRAPSNLAKLSEEALPV